jgi:hypothetical protein
MDMSTMGEFEQAVRRKRAEALGETIEEETPDAPPEEEPEPEPAEREGEPEEAPPPGEEGEGEDEEDAAAAAADAAEAELGEDATEEEISEARQAATDEFYVGRYKTREEAERGIAENHETTARLFQEINELKQQLAEPEPEPGPEQLDVRAWQEQAAEMVATGVGRDGALAFLREGGHEGYDIYLREWVKSEDPAQLAEALSFNTDYTVETARAAAQQVAAPALERDSQARSREEAEAAYGQLASIRSDLPEMRAAMDEIVDELDEGTRRWLTDQAQSGLEGKLRSLDYVYLAAKANGGSRATEAQRVENARRVTSSDRAKVRGTVSSAEGTTARTSLSATEQYVLDRKNGLRRQLGLAEID